MQDPVNTRERRKKKGRTKTEKKRGSGGGVLLNYFTLWGLVKKNYRITLSRQQKLESRSPN